MKGKSLVLETESESEKDLAEFRGFENDVEEEKSKGFLNFKFPTFEEFGRSKKKTGNLFNSEVVPFVDEEAISPRRKLGIKTDIRIVTKMMKLLLMSICK